MQMSIRLCDTQIISYAINTGIELSGLLSQQVTAPSWCRGDRSCWRGYCRGMRYHFEMMVIRRV